RQVVHGLDPGHVLRRAGRVGRRGRLDLRLRPGRPALRLLQPVLQVADAGEILVEPAAVVGAEVSPEVPGLPSTKTGTTPCGGSTNRTGPTARWSPSGARPWASCRTWPRRAHPGRCGARSSAWRSPTTITRRPTRAAS